MTDSKTTFFHPLSSTQRVIWYDQLLHPDLPLCNIGGCARIYGALDPVVFKKAVAHVMTNHEALRTMLHQGELEPSQYFVTNFDVPVELLDFSDCADPYSEADRWMKEAFSKPFECYHNLLAYYALCKVSNNCFLWFAKYHHIIADGQSISLIGHWVAEAYEAIKNGESLVVQPSVYTDFLVEDETYQNSAHFAISERFWREKFLSLPDPLPLSSDYEAGDYTNSQKTTWVVPSTLFMGLEAFAKEIGVSTFHVILASFYAYFAKTYNRDDLVFGLPIRNRKGRSLKKAIGLFAANIPAWFQLSRTLNFTELAQAIQAELRKSYRHQRFPINEISRNAGLFAKGRKRLYEIEFSYQNHDYDAQFIGHPMETLPLFSGHNQNALSISVREFHKDSAVRIDFEYNLKAFQSWEIDTHIANYEFLLDRLIASPQVPLCRHANMSEKEMAKLLALGRGDAPGDLPEKCAHQLFEDQVNQRPDTVAINHEGHCLSYRELNVRANQLAQYLIERGVAPETLIAVSLDRSAALLIALLGVLKAGAAYVPLDAELPLNRLCFMIEDAACRLLITQAQSPLLSQVDLSLGAVQLDEEWPLIAEDAGAAPKPRRFLMDHTAYVMFTSGSTGQPKGVRIPHRALSNLLTTLARSPGFSNRDVILAIATISFDIAYLELFLPLAVGAGFVLVSRETARDGFQLIQILKRERATVLQATPTTWRLLMESGWRERLPLRAFCGGEALPPKLAAEMKARTQLVWNMYGPTEATIYSVIGTVDNPNIITIGRPVGNIQAYILDRFGEPTAPGVSGELHLAGVGLARGYVNRPDLTAEKFIPCPFNEKPPGGERMYRTGDLTHWSHSGEVVFLGRIDFQVKIRGFRIELGEIEAVLEEMSEIEMAVIIPDKNENGAGRLLACMVASPPQMENQLELKQSARKYVQAKLPQYMVPSTFVLLESMPKTASGKVDRKLLLELAAMQAYSGVDKSEEVPRTLDEELLCGIWSELLEVDKTRLTLDSDFFELGGHSLTATRLITMIRNIFQVDLSLREIFAAPTIKGLAARLGELCKLTSELATPSADPEGQAYLESIFAQRREGQKQPVPLSFSQQRLWFLDRLEGPSSTYNMPGVLRIKGSLSVTALESALNKIIARHDSLRSRFTAVDDQAFQIVDDYDRFSLPLLDFSCMNAAAGNEWAERLCEKDAGAVFDLEYGPLLRLHLIRLSPVDHLLAMNMHHMVSDGWSVGILIKELRAFYSVGLGVSDDSLPPLAGQYADYAIWQREWFQGEPLQHQLDFWKAELEDAPRSLELPTIGPRPKVQRFRGRSEHFNLSSDMVIALKNLARETHATLFLVLQTAFAELLGRYGNTRDVLLGTPVANRRYAQLESLIGFFVNTLVLRNRLDEGETVRRRIISVHEVTLNALTHQDLPFEKLVEALNPVRDTSRSPLFQVMFSMQHTYPGGFELPGASAEITEAKQVISKFDLTLNIVESKGTLQGDLEYDSDLFEPAMIRSMAGHFNNLLKGFIRYPNEKVARLPLPAENERARLLETANANKQAINAHLNVCQLFEAQVAKAGDSVALVFQGAQVTYAKLKRKVDLLSCFLMESGCNNNSLVALQVERSIGMVTAMLAILKTGAAYIPLDPHLPPARFHYILQDAGCNLLVTQHELYNSLALEGLNPTTVFLDREWPENERTAPDTSIHGAQLAYMIYTSGSTGKPKGVMVSHHALVNYAMDFNRHYKVTSQDCVLQFASISFDVHAEEIYPCLMVGGRLVLRPILRGISFSDLELLLAREKVSILPLPTAYWHAWVNESPVLPSCLRVQIIGGEACSRRHFLAWRRLTGGQVLLSNAYGPTEATITATRYDADEASPGAIVPIGRPISNYEVYALDTYLEPVPTWVPGEIFIAGSGLARGYLHQPDHTAACFLPHPYASVPGARLYRTGDRGFWTPSGQLTFVGRVDFQVKVRGFRIELDEICNTLERSPVVAQATVLLKDDRDRGQSLVAFVVPAHQGGFTEAECLTSAREYAQKDLPEYMVPATFIVLESLPETINGKLDRKRLLEIAEAQSNDEETSHSTALRTIEEEMLQGIWSEILNMEPENINIEADFFALGGHSLAATRMTALIRKRLQVEVPLRDIFARPTIKALAAHLPKLHGSVPPSPRTVKRGPGPIPLSFSQQRLWFLDRLEGQSATYNMFGAFQLKGYLDITALEKAFDHIVARHESLRTHFIQVDDQACQVIKAHDRFNLTMVKFSRLDFHLAIKRSMQLMKKDAAAGFNLARGPLLRVYLFRLSSTHHLLSLNMHHSISDGWSVVILTRELQTFYKSLEGLATEIPPHLPIQYADYAVWQRKYLEGGALQRQLEFWKAELKDAPQSLELPTIGPRPKQQRFIGGKVAFRLESELVQGLKRLAKETGATLFIVLQTVFAELLGRYGNAGEVLIGTPVANRRHADFESLIGFFVNTLVMRNRLDAGDSVLRRIAAAQKMMLNALSHQDLPFEKLVEALNPVRDTSRSPLFQVMFAMETTDTLDFDLPALEVEQLEAQHIVAKFDLTLNLTSVDDMLLGNMEYDLDLFSASMIQAMVDHFTNLLHAFTVQPTEKVIRLAMMTEAERAHLIQTTSSSQSHIGADLNICQLFGERAHETPHAMAVSFQGTQITYAELDRRSEMIAGFLIGFGCTHGALVALQLDRSIEMIVAILGILKTGSAYIPLDPYLPRARCRLILEDAGCAHLVTQQDLAASMDLTGLNLQPVLIERVPQETVVSTRVGRPPITGANLVYLIYTSGSTGKPKGVMISHGALVNHTFGFNSHLQITASDRILQFSSIGFDASALEIYPSFAAGACLVLRPAARSISFVDLDRLLARECITYQFLTTSYWHAWVNEAPVLPSHLRLVVIGGEACNRQHYLEWRKLAHKDLRWCNLYGPTETTVSATRYILEDEIPSGNVPIGRPNLNYDVYVLDPHLELIPPLVTGGIYISGSSLGQGYLNEAALTASAFLPNPHSTIPGSRMYKTGDQGFWTATGQLIFVGRVDFQVKIRGFRIELDEVGNTLERSPLVAQAIVLVKKDSSGDQSLVAFIIPVRAEEPSSAECLASIRAFAKNNLPDYMVPSDLILLESLPKTINGKLDRKRLLTIAEEQAGNDPEQAAITAPRTVEEELFRGIWADVLDLEKESVGIDSNFFEQGGHSLAATRLTAQVRKTFQVELPLRDVFATPTIRALAARLPELRGDGAPPPTPRTIQQGRQVIPLSFAQRRLWFLDRLEGPSATYNIMGAFHMKGALEVKALELAIDRVIARHESLRTHFIEIEGQASQVVKAHRPFHLTTGDLSRFSHTNALELAKQLAEKEAAAGFDLSRGPLLRVHLIRLAQAQHFLVLNMHHTISDGWSVGLFIKELEVFYKTALDMDCEPLQPLPVQYADYAVWQRDNLEGGPLQRQLDFWQAELEDAPQSLELPTIGPRPKRQRFQGDRVSFSLEPDLVAGLKNLVGETKATLFLVLQTIFAELLGRYGNAREVMLGTPVANRRYAELEPLIGFFVNTLVLRNRLNSNESVHARIAASQQMILRALSHQDLPFEKLVEALNPVRDTSRSPLFQVMFTMVDAASLDFELPALTLDHFDVGHVVAKFDLTLNFIVSDTTLEGGMEYDIDLFSAHMIQAMIGHFKNLVRGFVQRPNDKVHNLPMLTASERGGLIQSWNQTAFDYPKQVCLHQLIEAQVLKTPAAVALVFEDNRVTYQELNALANQMARCLIERGAGPESLIGVSLERSAWMVISLLAVLKAGAAYVPIDPQHPTQRKSVMLQDAQCPVLITDTALAATFPLEEFPERNTLLVDRDLPELASYATANLDSKTHDSNQSAYVIYTSGSTGKPKGVNNAHRGVVNRLLWMRDALELNANDRILQKTPFSFDVSVWELFWPLLTGATEVIARPGGHGDPVYLADLIADSGVSILHFVPSMLAAFLEAEPRTVFPPRAVICSGEALPPTLRDRFIHTHPQTKLYNLYGPTEAAIDVTWSLCAADEPLVPIGKPIANTQIHVVDPYSNLVPPSVAGELMLAGIGLARGYHQRPDLTAQTFVPNPFSPEPGARLYKSGDLGRRLADGNLAYLGRLDAQVKIRGFRIELGEIASLLEQLPDVSQAAVLVHKTAGDDRLLAFLASGEQTVSADEGYNQRFQAYLAERLPDYMVPSAFIALDSLPITSNGKLDRKRLIKIAETQAGLDPVQGPITAPRTIEEELLRGIWAEILELEKERIGIDANFFALGGHSLTATRLTAQVRKTFQVELPLREVFATPTIKALAARLPELRGDDPLPAGPQTVKRDGQAIPLSFAQQRLWFLNRLEGSSATYNMCGAFDMVGNLEVTALEQAIDRIVARHESLRTHFAEVEGRARQVIKTHQRFSLTMADLSNLNLTWAFAKAKNLAQIDAAASFDLEHGPLLRVYLLRLRLDRCLLVLNMHHSVSDGWSLGVFINELQTFYRAAAGMNTDRPAPLPIQYADYAIWQRDSLAGEVLKRQLDFWKKELEDAPQSLELPTIGPRPKQQRFLGRREAFSLEAEYVDALKLLADETQATLFLVLQTIFAELLGRYGNTREVMLGTPVANRRYAELEPLIGFFVNTLVLRNRPAGGDSVRSRISTARQMIMSALSNQDLPFEKLVEAVNPVRDTSRAPLFQAMFTMGNLNIGDFELPGLHIEPLEEQHVVAKFDLTLNFIVSDTSLEGSIEYDLDLFSAHMIQAMIGHFKNLVRGFVQRPNDKVHNLPMLTESERGDLIQSWNQTAFDYPKQVCLHQLIEAQVLKTPAAVALVFEDNRVTYQELNALANQMARGLIERGAGPESLVGVSLERSAWMVISLLAVLKAGAAYVPIDPQHPSQRKSVMLQDAQCPVLITDAALAATCPLDEFPELNTLLIDRDLPELATFPTANLDLTAHDSNQSAYVIYTSGSTGKPKGVNNAHRGVVNRLLWMRDALELSTNDRILQKTPFSFDVSVWELFWPLLTGATEVIARPGGHGDPAYLADLIADNGVSILHFVPSMLAAFLEAEPRTVFPPRAVICSGEALPPSLRDRFIHTYPHTKLYNLYGPTEAAIDVTWSLCAADEPLVPIGKPIANTQIHVVDPYGNLVPPSVAGELMLAGIGLARGYHQRPDLTAQTFVPNPFSAEPGARLYKSGDLGRRLADGNLVYLGRLDAQVKIRGFRIELGEIASLLEQLPDVSQAAVLVHKAAGDDRLLAFLASGEQPATANEGFHQRLQAYLAEKLPDYMVPSAFIALDSLPITSNGKLDRKRLIKIAETQTGLDPAQGPITAPRTIEEELLRGIWADILELEKERISIDANFFALGGHSLTATRLTAQVRKTFQVELPLREVFAAPTIKALAARLPELRNQGPVPPPPQSIERGQGPIPLSFAQRRLWFLNRLEGPSATYNMFGAFRLNGPLNLTALEKAFDRIIARHESLRTRFTEIEGQPCQMVDAHTGFVLTVVDLTQQQDQARPLMEQEAGHSFDLQNDTLLRVSLFRLSPEAHMLLVNMQHAISDGWSLGVFINELQTFYRAYPNLDQRPPLPCQYADYTIWQRSWLEGDVLNRQLGYWSRQLESAPQSLELPTRGPRPEVRQFNGKREMFKLDETLTHEVNQQAQRTNATPFLVLQAVFAELMGRYANAREVLVGTPIANRRYAELEPLIGFFVNTLVLRNRIDGEMTVNDRIAHTREMALAAFDHQDLPFELLVEALNPVRDTSRSPLFQVLFSMVNTPMADFHLPGISIEPMEETHRIAKFDLSLNIVEVSDWLQGGLEYDSDLFEPAMIRAMIGHFTHLLRGFTAQPEAKLCRLPMLSDGEQAHVLQLCNQKSQRQTGTDAFMGTACIHHLFERRAEQRPNDTALIFDDRQNINADAPAFETMTYAALNQQANRIAHFLIKLGAGPDVPIGISVERGLPMVVAILAILKSGSAYVPLDPSNPDERLALIVEDSGIALLLTQSALAERCDFPGLQRIFLDTEQDAFSDCSTDNPSVQMSAANLAYIIYTSGSTGVPKGVLLPHYQVVRLFEVTEPLFQFSHDDVWTLFHSYAFDFSVWELWGALAYGGSLVVVPYWVARSPQSFYTMLDRHRVTVLNQTPSAFQQLIPLANAPDAPDLSQLRLIIFGGEALVPAKLAGWFNADRNRSTRLVNMYGITETTVHVTHHDLASQSGLPTTIPIGGPLADLTAYLLDRYHHPVPQAVQGEIYVGGEGLARGYLGKPALTAERFLPNPFARESGGRMYRSGDLAYCDAMGQLIYTGRADRQVKLRGFRIELGEIETAIANQPGVHTAVVIVPKAKVGHEKLVAYVVADKTAPAPDREWRESLESRLPNYMIPSSFIFLDQLPMTANNKIDLNALPEPEREKEVDAGRSRGQFEEIIAAIWAEVLEQDAVDEDDDFFELGGHSLLATQVVSRIRETFDVALPLARFFAEPRLGAVARLVETLRREGGQKTATPPKPVTWTEPIPLSYAQQVMWLAIVMEEGQGISFNIPFAAKLVGRLDLAALTWSLNGIVARHETLRTRFVQVKGQPSQLIEEARPLSLTVTDLRHLTDAEDAAHALVAADIQRPFDPERERLIRVGLLQTADNTWVLSCSMLHLISDGWSLGVWARELGVLYEAYCLGRPSPLEPLPIQYADFVHWQRHSLTERELARQLSYWKSRLHGAPPLIHLPLDYPRGEAQTNRGDSYGFEIGPQLTARLEAVARQHAATMFMLLQTAFALLLQRYSGQDDVVIGTSIANRHYKELEGLIGLFSSIQALRCNLAGDPELPDLLKQVRRASLEAHDNQDLPFESLIEALRVDRNSGYPPIFQVMFVLQNSPLEALQLPALQFEALETKLPIAKYDLTLFVSEGDRCLLADLEYNTDLFKQETIAGMAEQLIYLLEDISKDHSQKISAYSTMEEALEPLAHAFMDDLDFE